MSDNTVGNDETLKPIFAVPDNELRDNECPICDDVMAAGAVVCDNGHVTCARCAKNSTPKAFGIRDLVLRSSLDEVLKWRGLSCGVCGVRGPLRRSSVTEAAVAALPLRCGFTALGVACRWTGRRDGFHAHEHAFSDPDQLQPSTGQRPPWRGTKRPNWAPTSDSDNDDQRAKQARHQQTSSVEKKSEDEIQFQTAQTTDSNVADINAAGELASNVVAAAEVQRFNRFNGDEIFLDVGQIEDEIYTSQGDQTTERYRSAAVPDVIEADESEFCFVDIGETGETHGNDAGVPYNAAASAVQGPATGSHDEDQETSELHANQEGLQTVQQKVGDTEVTVDDGAEFTRNAAQEEDEFYVTADNETQAVQNSPTNNRSEAANPVSSRALAEIVPGEFHTVELSLQNAGLIPKPTVSLVDRAAKTIYDAIARTVHRVANTFQP